MKENMDLQASSWNSGDWVKVNCLYEVNEIYLGQTKTRNTVKLLTNQWHRNASAILYYKISINVNGSKD